MSATIRQIVDDAQTIIGEVAGAGVQTYSEDRQMRDVVRGFNLLFKKRFWEQYCSWFRVELNGATGVILTDTFEQVQDFEDFQRVHRKGEATKLPVLPSSVNPLGLVGTQVMYWTSLTTTHANYGKRKLQFYPLTSVGFVDVRARVYPLVPPAIEFDWEDVLYLDRDMLAYGTAYMTLAGDDLNPGSAEIARGLMETRYKDIVASLASHDVVVSRGIDIPRHWSTSY